jgi:hypothetical protein
VQKEGAVVNKRRGNKQGGKGAMMDLDVVSSRLMDIDDELEVAICTSSHCQVRRQGKVLLDIWPTTGKFRVHDAPQGSPAVVGIADDVLDVVEWLLSKSSG